MSLLSHIHGPISILPAEVLGMIFQAGMCLGKRDPQCHFELLVSHVSSRWRTIALATPTLWVDIQYSQPHVAIYTGRAAPKAQIERIGAYLSRSRSMPIDMHIGCYCKDHLPLELYPLIGDHMRRCRSLQIWGVANEAHHESLRRLHECVSRPATPLLLSFSMTGSLKARSLFLDLLFQFTATRLIDVSLHAPVQIGTVQLSCLPATKSVVQLQLTGICICDEESYGYFRGVLMSLKVLSHLELKMCDISQLPDIAPHQSPIVLATIQYLHLDFEECPAALGSLIECIHAPSLLSLSLAGRCAWSYGETQTLLEPVESHFPSLRHLIVGKDVSFALAGFDFLAETFSNIKRLTCRVKKDSVYGGDINDILATIMVGLGDDDEEWHELDYRRLWPQIQAIAVSTLQEPLNAAALRLIIHKLQEVGHPICKLLLPTECIGEEGIVELKELVDIEDFVDDFPRPFKPF